MIYIPVSVGELADKITILELKARHISNLSQRMNIHNELNLLKQVWMQHVQVDGIEPLLERLALVNQMLWQLEDRIRELGSAREFGTEFIDIACSIYEVNDLRAAVKRQINQLCGSGLIEEKSYKAISPV